MGKLGSERRKQPSPLTTQGQGTEIMRIQRRNPGKIRLGLDLDRV